MRFIGKLNKRKNKQVNFRKQAGKSKKQAQSKFGFGLTQKQAQISCYCIMKQQNFHKIWKTSNLQNRKSQQNNPKTSNPQAFKKTLVQKKNNPKLMGKPQGWQHCFRKSKI